jgi:drug/metabolite transporter (DMT)-like permease
MYTDKFSRIDVFLIIISFLWGINSPMMKAGISYIPVNAYNSMRMILGAIACWIILFILKKYQKFEKKDITRVILVSCFGFFPMLYFFTVGLAHTTSGNGALTGALVPTCILIVNFIFKTEKISLRLVMGIIISFSGVAFIIVGSGKDVAISSEHLYGIILLILAQFSNAIYTIFSKEIIRKYSIYLVFAYMVTITTVLLTIIGYKELIVVEWTKLPYTIWFNMIYSGVVAACFSHFIWVWGVQIIGSTRTSVYNNLIPISGVLFGCTYLGEHFGIFQLIGAVIIFSGLYITRVKQKNIIDVSSEV